MARVLLPAILGGAVLLAGPGVLPAQKPKLPKPAVLERGARFERDPVTGEMTLRTGETAATLGPQPPAPVIRTRVSLVEVGCTVTAPDGTRVRDLTRDTFRLLEDGT